MHWVSRRLEQRAALRVCRQKLTSGGEAIWESLCQAVKDSLEAYKKDGAVNPAGRFEPDSKNHHLYWIRYVEDTPNRNTEKNKITITFDAVESTITAVYDTHGGAAFGPRLAKLILDNDGNICFRIDHANFYSAATAAYLMDPFLFPDLAANPVPQEDGFFEWMRQENSRVERR